MTRPKSKTFVNRVSDMGVGGPPTVFEVPTFVNRKPLCSRHALVEVRIGRKERLLSRLARRMATTSS